jgi:hypothetical protein
MIVNVKMESPPIEEPPEAIIPTEIVSSGGQSATITTDATGRLVRKVARRTESWYPQPPPPPPRSTRQRELPTYFASLPPQAEDIPARAKKRRLEKSLPTPKAKKRATTTDKAARKTASPDISVGLPPPTAADGDIVDANTDANFVTDTQPNAVATGNWTLEEDAKLTSAVTNAPKKKHHREYKPDWVAISALVPGRTRKQCSSRWCDFLDPSIGQASGRKGIRWTVVEDSKLKDAVRTHGGKNWCAISALVPGRTIIQCRSRWHEFLDPNIDSANERTGKWTADEDSKLKDAVQTHGGKNWGLVAGLVLGRTGKQCGNRWRDVLDPIIDRTPPGRTGNWTAVEDSQLKDAVRAHGGKNWCAISVLVPGRTNIQCRKRWKDALDPNLDLANGRTGKWAEDEVAKLDHAVRTHGDKNWKEVAALVPGRTKQQCCDRWLR